jgi:hypothetical protein
MSSARYDSDGNIVRHHSPKKKKSRDFDDLRIKNSSTNKSEKYKDWRQFVTEDDDEEKSHELD